MIVLVGSEKGGTGKTTIATNLAVMRALEKKEALLFDADSQKTSSNWVALRDERKIKPSIFLNPKSGMIDTEINKHKEKFKDIVIDAGGYDGYEIRSGLTVADIFVLPMQISVFDTWGFANIANLVAKTKVINPNLEAYVIINKSPTNPSLLKDEKLLRESLSEAIEGLGNIFSIIDTPIKERVIFRRAAMYGKGIVEMDNKDIKAEQEIKNLYNIIFKREF